MRLGYSKSKNTIQFYVMKDTIKNGKRSTKIVKKLGNLQTVTKKANGQDPYVWAKKYIEDLNLQEQHKTRTIMIQKSQNKLIKKMFKILLTVVIYF